MHHRPVRPIALALVVALGLVATGCSGGGSSDDAAPTSAPVETVDGTGIDRRTVTTTATGEARATPDNLIAEIAVTNAGEAAAQVMGDNNATVARLIDQVREAGIPDADVQTASIDLGPLYDEDGKITGYRAGNTVRVTFRDLSVAGIQLDATVRAVGDRGRINWVRLGFDDDDAVLSDARTDAVAQARAQAEEMAAAAGASVGEVRTITDVPNQFADGAYAETTAAFALDSARQMVPIMPGSEEIQVQVQVVFELA